MFTELQTRAIGLIQQRRCVSALEVAAALRVLPEEVRPALAELLEAGYIVGSSSSFWLSDRGRAYTRA